MSPACLPRSSCSTEQQRALVHRGDNGLQGALNSKLMPTLQLWLDTFEECKVRRGHRNAQPPSFWVASL